MAATLSGSCGVLGLVSTIVDVVRLGDGDTLGLGVVVFGLIGVLSSGGEVLAEEVATVCLGLLDVETVLESVIIAVGVSLLSTGKGVSGRENGNIGVGLISCIGNRIDVETGAVDMGLFGLVTNGGCPGSSALTVLDDCSN